MQSLDKLSVVELDLSLKSLRTKERETLSNIIFYLSELDKRKAYRELGYSSLFTYCTEGLKYSEASAYRRVQAVKTQINNPEVINSLKEGKLSLSAITEVSKIKDEEVKRELIKSVEGKKTSEIKAITAPYLPFESQKKDSIKVKAVPANKDLFNENSPKENILKYNFHMEVDKEFMGLYEEMRKVYGYLPSSEIFKRSMKECLHKRNTIKRKTEVKVSNETRFIPKATKLIVLKRDDRQCAFIGNDGRRCTEKHALEFDHIIPFGKGGDNSQDNLRLLCRSHNQLMAERSFGGEKIRSYA